MAAFEFLSASASAGGGGGDGDVDASFSQFSSSASTAAAMAAAAAVDGSQAAYTHNHRVDLALIYYLGSVFKLSHSPEDIITLKIYGIWDVVCGELAHKISTRQSNSAEAAAMLRISVVAGLYFARQPVTHPSNSG